MSVIEPTDAGIVRRYEAGDTLAAIGATVGLTRERVRQIVRAAGAVMPWDYKCAVPDCQRSPRTPNAFCFAHQRRLDRYGDPLGVRQLRRDQHRTRACYRVARCRCELCRRTNAERVRERLHRLHLEMRRYGSA